METEYMRSGNVLPKRIFFTGVPGSRWSGIAQTIESLEGFNTSDRTAEREFSHSGFTGHKGAYFGKGMEFEPMLNAQYIDSAWTLPGGTRIVKSHDWAYGLEDIEQQFSDDWIMLVYRPDMQSYAWWHEAGGFNIKYPCYDAYIDSTHMLAKITEQNQAILEYAQRRDATWHYFTPKWIENNFKQTIEVKRTWSDILVTLLK